MSGSLKPEHFTPSIDECSAVVHRAGQLYPEVFGVREQEVLSRLFSGRAVLSPDSLAELQPQYENFEQRSDLSPLIFIKRGSLPVGIGEPGVMVAFMGPSASGKDAILDLQDNRLFTMVQTTTTRPNTERDKPRGRYGVEPRYTFATAEAFEQHNTQGEFIETVRQGRFIYGTPASAVSESLRRPEPIKVWRGEVSGVISLSEWMRANHPEVPFLSLFILPMMTLSEYCTWLGEKRGDEAEDWRFPKALWEIVVAGERADIIVENPPDPTGLPREASEATRMIFERFVGR